MKFLKKNIVLILIGLISSILVACWFKEGFILGTAESLIPFYNLESQKHITEWAWMEMGLGGSTGISLSLFPTLLLLSALQKIGVSGFLVQAGFFWFLLTAGGLGIYLLTKLLFPYVSKRYLFIATLFYWFNPLFLVVVWNRFLYTHMVFFAMLPLIVFLFVKGLEVKKYFYGVLTALVLTFFSYSFTYVFTFLSWSVLTFCSLFYILTTWKKGFIKYVFPFFFSTLLIFLAMNAWWFLPTIDFFRSANTAKEFSFFITTAGNVQTLTILSEKLGNLIDIVRFFQVAFFNGEGPSWGRYANFPLISILLFTVPGIIFWGIYKLKKDKNVLFLGTLLILSIFLAKGNNSPFGGFFDFFFRRISFLQIFRDPFEKFSFTLILAAAPLLAVSLFNISKSFNKALKIFTYLLILLLIGIFSIPFFTGLVFTGITPPSDDYDIGYKVKVPQYYADADNWLKRQGKNFRFISFPLGDEGATYNWEKGYEGVEPSSILFSTPGITFDTTIPYYSQIVAALEKLFFQEKDFYKVANLLNVKYFLVHSDVDIRERRLRDPQSVETLLNNRQNEGIVKKVAQFDKLTVWENLKWIDKTVYAANNLIDISPQAAISDVLFNNNETKNQSDVVCSAGDINKPAESTVIYPEEENHTANQEPPIIEKIKNYRVDIKKQADYELVLSNVNFTEKESTIAAQLQVRVDNKLISQKGVYISNNKISFGQISLSSGMHEISINRPISQNLVSAPENVVINSNSNTAVFEINNFDPYSRYLVSFDYLIKSGIEFVFMFQQSNDLLRNGQIVPQYPYFNVLEQDNLGGSRHSAGIFIPKRSDKANIFFGGPTETNVILKNISVNRLIDTVPVLIRINSEIVAPQAQIITYTKINPSKYSVHIQGASQPFVLVLSELFNDGWEARFEDNSRAQNHFLANAYANGWIIDKTGNFDLTLEFAPQRLLDIGRLISSTTILIGLIYIGSILLKKKKI